MDQRLLCGLFCLLGSSCAQHAAAPAARPAAQGPSDPASLQRGRGYTEAFYARKYDDLLAVFSEPMRKGLPRGDLEKFREQIRRTMGDEKRVIKEESVGGPYGTQYSRFVEFERVAGPYEVRWTFNDTGTILGFHITRETLPAPSEFLDYETRAELRVPFDGTWYVYWGGRTVIENYHVAVFDQRFALDLLVVKDGKTHAGDGTKNTDYYCFGQSILAPASGTVVTAVDQHEDLDPGKMDPSNPAGNHIIVDLGNDEFAFLAHLRRGSVEVEMGDRIESGQKIAECGNSGNTSEPHLHFHVQDTPIFGDGAGLPAQFVDYVVGVNDVDRGELRRGQVVTAR